MYGWETFGVNYGGDRIQLLEKRLTKCIELNGDYKKIVSSLLGREFSILFSYLSLGIIVFFSILETNFYL